MPASILWATCPHCQRPLRVPRQYVGQSVSCLHCRHTFRVDPSDHETETPLPSTPAAPAVAEPLAEVAELRDQLQRERDNHRRTLRLSEALTAALEAVYAERDQYRSQHARAHNRAEALAEALETARNECDLLRDEGHLARSQCEERGAEIEKLGRLVASLEVVRAERDSLVAQRRNDTALIERLRVRLAELERSVAEVTTRREADYGELAREFEEQRACWEAERQGLLSLCEAQGPAEGEPAPNELRRARDEAQRLELELSHARSWAESVARDHAELVAQVEALRAELGRRREAVPILGIVRAGGDDSSVPETTDDPMGLNGNGWEDSGDATERSEPTA